MEEYRMITGYEELYKISNFGNVVSLAKKVSNGICERLMPEKVLKQSNMRGYKRVMLHRCGRRAKNFFVHRLLAIEFIPNPHNKPEVNHKDGNRANNNVSNLEWCTSKENHLHSYKELGRIGAGTGKISHKRKAVLQFDLVGNFIKKYAHAYAAETDKFNQDSISLCCNGKNKTHKGFIWKFA